MVENAQVLALLNTLRVQLQGKFSTWGHADERTVVALESEGIACSSDPEACKLPQSNSGVLRSFVRLEAASTYSAGKSGRSSQPPLDLT